MLSTMAAAAGGRCWRDALAPGFLPSTSRLGGNKAPLTGAKPGTCQDRFPAPGVGVPTLVERRILLLRLAVQERKTAQLSHDIDLSTLIY